MIGCGYKLACNDGFWYISELSKEDLTAIMNALYALIISIFAVVSAASVERPEETNLKMNTSVKRSDLFNEFALAEYLFTRADVNKDGYLTRNEIYNLYRHDMKWPFQKAADMSIKLMKIGDRNKDQKLGAMETLLALSKVTDQITGKE